VAVVAGVLSELGGGAAARVAERCPSVVLTRGAVWRSTQGLDAVLVGVDEGFVFISAESGDDGNGGGNGHRRRIVVATGQPGMLLPSPGAGEQLEALTAARVSIVAAGPLKALLRFPLVAEAIAEAVVDGLRDRQASIRNCTYVRHSERVRQTLLQLAGTYGRVAPRGIRIDFPLTHQLLADMVGSARETVSLALAELSREGFLHRHHRDYIIRVCPHELSSTVGPSVGAADGMPSAIDLRRAPAPDPSG
jgi:CRP-like cAMP-binding protein